MYRKANAAYYMCRKMKSTYHPEYKLKDSDLVDQDINTTGYIHQITNISQGADYANRIGRSVTIKSIFLRMACKLNANVVAGGFQQIRVLLVHALTDVSPSFAIVFNTSSGDEYTYNRNVNYTKDFKVIYDKVITLNYGRSNCIQWKRFIKRNSVCKWTAAQSAGTATEYGHYYIMVLSSYIADYPTFSFNCRVRFVDV
jgi:hypothetical protein